jgi:hypothetical protein
MRSEWRHAGRHQVPDDWQIQQGVQQEQFLEEALGARARAGRGRRVLGWSVLVILVVVAAALLVLLVMHAL